MNQKQEIVDEHRHKALTGQRPMDLPVRWPADDWSGLDFSGVSWWGYDFTSCKLHQANFSGCKFTGTVLKNAELWDAKLCDADFTEAIGLLPDQLSGADLTRAKLPAEIAKFSALEQIKELSQSAGKVFFTLLGVLAFTVLAIASSSDFDLLTVGGTTDLPIIGSKIPITSFCVAIPLLLIFVYAYLHLYIYRVVEALGGLPAVFPDGRTADQTSYPWLVNDLCRAYLPRLKKVRALPDRLQVAFTFLIGWWLTPIVVFFIWAHGLRAQSRMMSLYHVGCVALTVFLAFFFFWLVHWTLVNWRGRPAPFWARWQAVTWPCFLILLVVSVILLRQWTDGVLTTRHMPFRWTTDAQLQTFWNPNSSLRQRLDAAVSCFYPHTNLQQTHWQRWGPHLLLTLRTRPYANVEGCEFILSAPHGADFADQGPKALAGVKGMRFIARPLRQLWAQESVWVKVRMYQVELDGCDFQRSKFHNVWLSDVDASGSRFQDADFSTLSKDGKPLEDLDHRSIWGHGGEFTMLERCRFSQGLFHRAQLTAIKAESTSFTGAELVLASLRDASFSYCYFSEANLSGADLRRAHFSGDKGSNAFRNANLNDANCASTRFGNADLADATFSRACLAGADFSEVTNLRFQQLVDAGTLRGVKLPAYLSMWPLSQILLPRIMSDHTADEWEKANGQTNAR